MGKFVTDIQKCCKENKSPFLTKLNKYADHDLDELEMRLSQFICNQDEAGDCILRTNDRRFAENMLDVSVEQNCTKIRALASLVIGESRQDKELLELALELVKSELLEFDDEVLARLHLALCHLYRDEDPELALHHLSKIPDKLSPDLDIK